MVVGSLKRFTVLTLQTRPDLDAHVHALHYPLQENIVTVPNLLSVGRMALSPVTGYMVLESSYSCALGLFALVGVTDVVSQTRCDDPACPSPHHPCSLMVTLLEGSKVNLLILALCWTL